MRGGEGRAGSIHWQGEPVHVWEAVWGVPRFEAWARLDSTNDRARELVAAGAPAYTVVIADEQLRGRGRSGRRWASPAGKGLWMSVVLRPPARDARSLAPVVVGLAVCRAVEGLVDGIEAKVKWPNDVLVGGRKVCGILCEGDPGGAVVAGIGLNVSQSDDDFPPELRDVAVSLESAGGRPVDRGRLAGRLLDELRRVFDRPTLRLDGALGREMDRRDALRGRRVRVDGEVVGTSRGIGRSGELLVEARPGDVRAVRSGTVRAVDGGRSTPEASGGVNGGTRAPSTSGK